MANQSLFQTIVGKLLPSTNTINKAGSKAYKFSPQHTLAQYAATGCLNNTYYANAAEQLEQVLKLCQELPAEFIAKTAVYARERGFMKDMPALLCAILATQDRALLEQIFPRVINNSKMLRNFVQIIRAGVTGRRSLGTLPKRLILEWLANRSEEELFRQSVGQKPSLPDIIKMVHPRPQTPMRDSFYGYLLNKLYEVRDLPPLVQQYEAFKQGESLEIPDLPFQLLTALALSNQDWKQIAQRASWQTLRMNLNTFARHNVFEDKQLVAQLAAKLNNAQEIKRAKVFPYQLMTAALMADSSVPRELIAALETAMEVALENIPVINGTVYVCPDVSGSMSSPATGYRPGATSTVRCIDIAALMAAAMLRQNPHGEIIPFEHNVVRKLRLNPQEPVLKNAEKLARIGGGGTNTSAPLAWLNNHKMLGNLVIYISDNESWVDGNAHGRSTGMLKQWDIFKKRNPKARLVCIDIQPYNTTQAAESEDILNIGGFSDQVFDVIAEFAAGRLQKDHWVGIINKVVL
jgi:60 kDa SS-A/Ro ribonucleoprotein